MGKKLDDFLQKEQELLRTFRQSIQQRSNDESSTNSWKQQRLTEADTRLKHATDEIERIRREATNDLAKARDALKIAKDESLKVRNISPNIFERPEKTNFNYPASDETITELANKLTNMSSTSIKYANEVKEAVHHLQNWEWGKWENDRLNFSLFLLFFACVGVILFIVGIMQQSGILIFIGLFPPPLLLAFADTVWNLGKKEPGSGFSKGYLWFYLVAPIVPFIALGWIFASYPASLTAIDKRYQPRANRYVVSGTVHGIGPRLIQVLLEAELYHDILMKQTQQQMEQMRQEHESSVQQIEAEYQKMTTETLSNHEVLWQQIQKQISILQQTLALTGAPWEDHLWESWTPPTEEVISSFLRIGSLVDQGKRKRLILPALVPIIGKGNVVIKCFGEAKEKAVQIVRNLMLRMLSVVPPGKLRFILIDPVGLGQSMAAFMNLDDYDETLIGGKIWTESQHIEGQLARLTEHMEFVIQKFLRDKYPTIEDYNTEAGEVAEPYRLLVIINFPVNFSEAAARRLVSITLNGPRCGIYTIMTIDTEQKLPYGFHEIATSQHAVKPRNLLPNKRKMYPAICSACGNECKVPFQPEEGRPVYCKACYAEIKNRDNEYDEDVDDD